MDLIGGISIENAAPLAVGQVAPKRRKKHHKPVEDCQNCGAKLAGEFCHECGQQGHVHRSVLHVIEEVFHGITHFDSRTWRSLPMLAFRPGTLTRDYVMGKRARYVPPFAMFLFSIFAMFLVFAFSGGPGLVSHAAATKAEAVQNAREAVSDRESDLKDAQSEAADAQKELAALRAETEPDAGEIAGAVGTLAAQNAVLANAQRKLDAAKAELAATLARPETDFPINQPTSKSKIKGSFSFNSGNDRQEALSEIAAERAKSAKDGDAVGAGVLAAAEAVAKAAPSSPEEAAKVETDPEDFMTSLKDSMRSGDLKIETPWPALTEKIQHKTENPDLFLYKLQNTAYKFSFLLVPLSLPFIWLMLFWKKDVTMFDHAVFSLYSLSFVSFLFMMISLGTHWFSLGPALGAAAILLPIHIFFQFKGAYQLKWFSAFWRTCLFCCVFSWIIISTFFVSIIALGVTG